MFHFFLQKSRIPVEMFYVLSGPKFRISDQSIAYERSYIFKLSEIHRSRSSGRLQSPGLDFDITVFAEIEFVLLEPRLARGFSTFSTEKRRKWRETGERTCCIAVDGSC